MRCPFCNAENPSEFSFCGYCGSPLNAHSNRCSEASHTKPNLSPERSSGQRFAVILFADIASFTHISEGLDPEQVTRLVNCCLGKMITETIKHGGRSNKYIGDGLMSIFNHSNTWRQNAKNAAKAALAIHKSVADLELGPAIPPLSLHIGIACGVVLAIEIASQQQTEYIFIGSAVNLASQLEEISAPGQTLVSEEIYHLLARDFVLRPTSLQIPQGSKNTETVYELIE